MFYSKICDKKNKSLQHKTFLIIVTNCKIPSMFNVSIDTKTDIPIRLTIMV